MSDQELREIAKDVRRIKNMQLYPAVARLGCMGVVLAVPISLFCLALLAGLMNAVGRLFTW